MVNIHRKDRFDVWGLIFDAMTMHMTPSVQHTVSTLTTSAASYMHFHDCCLCVEWICVHNAALSYLRVLCIPEESPRLSTVRLSLRHMGSGRRRPSPGALQESSRTKCTGSLHGEWGRHSHQHGPGAEPPALCNESVMDTFKHKLKTYPFWNEHHPAPLRRFCDFGVAVQVSRP